MSYINSDTFITLAKYVGNMIVFEKIKTKIPLLEVYII